MFCTSMGAWDRPDLGLRDVGIQSRFYVYGIMDLNKNNDGIYIKGLIYIYGCLYIILYIHNVHRS